MCLLSLPQLPCLHVAGRVASLSLDPFCKLRVMAAAQVNWGRCAGRGTEMSHEHQLPSPAEQTLEAGPSSHPCCQPCECSD